MKVKGRRLARALKGIVPHVLVGGVMVLRQPELGLRLRRSTRKNLV